MGVPRSRLPDPLTSRAVLVGVSDYSTLEPLPSVANNIATLRDALTDAELWGLPDEHCVALLNPASIDAVLEAVHSAASVASDALLFYFAGHGLLDERSDLYLALPGADNDRLHRAVRYDDIRREVVGTARACYGKVVILDCCYSGRALQGGMSGSVELADHATIDGTYLMTASAETSVALAPPEERYTAFTGALVDKVVHGLADGPDLLDMETLFHHVRADMKARLFPVPQARTRNDGKAIALVRNRRGSGRATPAPVERARPRPPAGMEGLLRRRPADVYAEVRALRANGQEDLATRLLTASAASRADQEVAAIVAVLRGQGTAADVRTVIEAAARRPAVEVLRIVEALHDTDLPAEADRLVDAAGAGPVDDMASLAHLLQTSGRAGELVRLLDVALDTAQADGSLIGLVNALWVAGLRDEVDGLIDRAVSRLSGPAVIDLADELRAVGREEAAFGLYVASTETAASRPPDVVAQLCQAMTDAGRARDSARLAQTMIDRAGDVESLLVVADAFWDSDQEHHADRTLTRAAAVLSAADVIALATEIRARDREEAAYELCRRAMTTRPSAQIHEMVAALREEGRPVDARKLLEEVVVQAPVRTVFELLAESGEHDRRRVLDAVTRREPAEIAELLDALTPTHPAIARELTDHITATATTRVALLAVCVDRMDQPSKVELFGSVVRTTDGAAVADLLPKLPVADARLLMFLAVKAGNPALARIVDALPADADGTGDPALRYLLDPPLEWLPVLVTGLRANHFDQYADALLNRVVAAGRSVHALARDVASLFAIGEPQTGRLLVGKMLDGRSNSNLTEMVGALRQQGRPDALAAAADWVRATFAELGPSNVDGILRQIGLKEFTRRGARSRR